MLISFETNCEVLTGWLGKTGTDREREREIVAAVVVAVVPSAKAARTFTCPLVLVPLMRTEAQA